MNLPDRKYMKTEDPDLKRLRQALCRAWKANAAGFEAGPSRRVGDAFYFNDTNEKFAKLLTTCGISTSKADVENAKKSSFKSQTVPHTERTREVFEKVKEIFQGLREEEIFAQRDTNSLLWIDKNITCPFIERLKGE